MRRLDELSVAGTSEKSPNISSRLVFCCWEETGAGTMGVVCVLPKFAAAPRSTSLEGLELFEEEEGGGVW